MLVISFYYNYDIWPIILISIYSFGIIINFVGVLLPVCCKKLSYDYKSSNNIINRPISSNFKEIKNEQTSDDEQIYPNKDDKWNLLIIMKMKRLIIIKRTKDMIIIMEIIIMNVETRILFNILVPSNINVFIYLDLKLIRNNKK